MKDFARWTGSPPTPQGETYLTREDGVRIKVVPAEGAQAEDVAELAAMLAVLPMLVVVCESAKVEIYFALEEVSEERRARLRPVMTACIGVLDRLQRVRRT